MNDPTTETSIAAAHLAHFGQSPQVVASAPGRVNLLGEHTDYNGGYVMPIALKGLGVTIAASLGETPGQVDIWSQTFDADCARAIDEPKADHWSDYILGCAAAIGMEEIKQTGLRLSASTTLPIGAGLSSSAAVEVATFRALSQLFDKPLTPVEVALAARAVENTYVGVPCGIMDQFASSVGVPGQALFLNTRTLDHDAAPGLPGYRFVVIDSCVSHQLSDGGYATRVAECQAACGQLGVALLSDLHMSDMDRIDALPEPLNLRARHVVVDNDLTRQGLAALKAGDAVRFGQLMIDSHASERDNFQITVPETDALADVAVSLGALGARQTGGGWGGAVVALVAEDRLDRWSQELAAQFPKTRLLAVT